MDWRRWRHERMLGWLARQTDRQTASSMHTDAVKSFYARLIGHDGRSALSRNKGQAFHKSRRDVVVGGPRLSMQW